jgi:hypothetical protein
MKPKFDLILTFSCPLGLGESSQGYLSMLPAKPHAPENEWHAKDMSRVKLTVAHT